METNITLARQPDFLAEKRLLAALYKNNNYLDNEKITEDLFSTESTKHLFEAMQNLKNRNIPFSHDTLLQEYSVIDLNASDYIVDVIVNEDPEDKNLDEDDTNRVKNRIDLANIGLCKLDNIRGDIFEDLLKLGINPGGYENNTFDKKCWTELYSWENGEYQGKSNVTDANRFQHDIWNEYHKELFKALFSSKRGIETLGIGIVTYDRTKYDYLTKTEQETVDAVMKVMEDIHDEVEKTRLSK